MRDGGNRCRCARYRVILVRVTPDLDVAGLEPFLAAGAELNSRYVITAPYDPDLTRLADRLAAIHDLAVRYGLQAVLEFFPWTVVPNLDAAISVVNAPAGQAFAFSWTRRISIAPVARSISSRERPVCVCPSRMSPTPRCRRVIQRKNCFTLATRSARPPARARSTPKSRLMEFRWRVEVPMTAMAATESFEAVALHVRRAASRLLATNARRPRRGCAFFSSISRARRRSAKV